ncbi:uncharacterized protein LOC125877602 [Solanum stenotomum]|uniref:uncharacterized protein LOC125877602 n=1 Tax=Solanum stenotomum TaxID=172797 RepID=UPI0020D19A62|nr:uncharacterized protein LOC125877602 [Solanum stenotomum]
MRESGLESLMDDVSSFCAKHDILVPVMSEDYPRSKRKKSKVSYLHHFRVEVFYAVIDLQLQELNNRFDVVTSDLLLGMASLNPVDSFANFSKSRIIKSTEYYKNDFGDNELRDLSYQLDSFIVYARECDSKFLNLKGIKDLAMMMTNKIGSNLVSCLLSCKVGFDIACCYIKCGKSILLNEAHKK